jgi:hypothetical protein
MQEMDLQTIGALVRAGGIAALSLAAALPVRDCLFATRTRRGRAAVWVLILSPWLTPALLVGYAYMPLALALVRLPGWKEAAYDFALWLRLTPVAVCALYFAPPPLTAQALHCYRLLPLAPGWKAKMIFRVRGAGRGPWAAFALVFLLAFSEFELASLWTVKTWTNSLFDAQTGGLPLTESLMLARWPLGCATAALAGALAALLRRDWLIPSPDHRSTAIGKMKRRWVWGGMAGAAAIAPGWPLARLLPEAVRGIDALSGNGGLGRDIVFSLLLAGCVAAGTWLAAGEGMRRVLVGGICAAPGLLGGLLLSLLALALFQLPGLRAVYGTPVPLLAALMWLLLPYAMLLRVLLRRFRASSPLHLARMIGDRPLCWEMDGHKNFWAGFLLFCWAYFDLTAASLLAPPGLTTAPVRLYNLMHYGRSPALAAMLCATIAAPALVALAVAPTVRAVLSRLPVRLVARASIPS